MEIMNTEQLQNTQKQKPFLSDFTFFFYYGQIVSLAKQLFNTDSQAVYSFSLIFNELVKVQLKNLSWDKIVQVYKNEKTAIEINEQNFSTDEIQQQFGYNQKLRYFQNIYKPEEEDKVEYYKILNGKDCVNHIFQKIQHWIESQIDDTDILNSINLTTILEQSFINKQIVPIVIDKNGKEQINMLDFTIIRHPTQDYPFHKIYRLKLFIQRSVKKVESCEQDEENQLTFEFSQHCFAINNQYIDRNLYFLTKVKQFSLQLAFQRVASTYFSNFFKFIKHGLYGI